MAIQYLQGRFPRAFEEPKTQVYLDTHNERGGAWERSPLMKRSFISFTFGGRYIEDFNLIAITKEDRINSNLYSDTNNIITNHDIIDGQYYWGTTMGARQIDLTLATDGVTEEQLNDFIYWFKPGVARELILAEHPNRAIIARLASTPRLSVLPFEKKTNFKFDGVAYPTSTTLYKGEISISFIADEPYWYARHNCIKTYYIDKEDKFGNMIANVNEYPGIVYPTLKDPDFIKVIIEDHIPHLEQIFTSKVLIGGNEIVNLDRTIVSPDEGTAAAQDPGLEEEPYTYKGIEIAEIDDLTTEDLFEGVVAHTVENNGVDLGQSDTHYLFYSGTAPSKPIIRFTLTPIIINSVNDENTNHHFIVYPLNSFTSEDWWQHHSEQILPTNLYNVLRVGNSEMRFSIPSIYLGFNEAKYIVRTMVAEGKNTVDEIREALRDGVHDTYAREWALTCLVGWEVVNFDDFSTRMNWFIMDRDPEGIKNGGDSFFSPVTFTFDSEKGTCVGEISIRRPEDGIFFYTQGDIDTLIANNDFPPREVNEPVLGYSTVKTVVENTGDMMQSPYLVINERCDFDENNFVRTEKCLPITTDFPGSVLADGTVVNKLRNVTINYKNMYF